jgi:hypothetical protein
VSCASDGDDTIPNVITAAIVVAERLAMIFPPRLIIISLYAN